VHDKSSGRIFKLVYNNQATTTVNLAASSDAELFGMVTSANEWQSRQARRILQERAPKGPFPEVEKLVREAQPREALRALWALHVTGNLSEQLLMESLARKDSPHLAGWAAQLACEEKKPSEKVRAGLAQAAASTDSAVVRLYLTSAAQRLPLDQRLPLIEPLLARAEDAKDHNLPLMQWYALEPVVGQNPALGATLLPAAKIPIVQEYIARRLATTAQAER
jgi:hypothetical protein